MTFHRSGLALPAQKGSVGLRRLICAAVGAIFHADSKPCLRRRCDLQQAVWADSSVVTSQLESLSMAEPAGWTILPRGRHNATTP